MVKSNNLIKDLDTVETIANGRSIEYKMNVEYAGQVMNAIPSGYINKTACGVGLTTVALENVDNVIIAVPSIELVKNKESQYPNERFNGKVLGVYGDVNEERVDRFIEHCDKIKLPIKIAVTYDSLKKVEHLLSTNRFKFIIDESDRLLSYTHMKIASKDVKGDKTRGFYREDVVSYVLDVAKRCQAITSFISATPTPTKFLPKWIGDLPQITYTWESTTEIKPMLMQRTYPYKALKEEVLLPMKVSERVVVGDRSFRKAIIFINSVTQIAKLIKETGIDKEDVRVICADSYENDIKIGGIKRLTQYDNLSKYTFVTSSGWQGIDLYDEDAMNVIVSSTTNSASMVDMTTDLKQATSRNRCKSNPNYDRYIYIYNQSTFQRTEEDLVRVFCDTKRRITINIETINKCDERHIQDANIRSMVDNKEFRTYAKPKKSFVDYSKDHDLKIDLELNEMAFNADMYFILEIRRQYLKGFEVVNKLGDGEQVQGSLKIKAPSYRECCKYFEEHVTSDGQITWPNTAMEKCSYAKLVEEYYEKYKTVDLNIDRVRKILNSKDELSTLTFKIKGLFSTGKRYTIKEIKDRLNNLYKQMGIKRSAKWQDLTEAGVILKDVKVMGDRYKEIVSK